MKFSARRCRAARIRTGRKNNFITRLVETYGIYVDIKSIPDIERMSNSQTSLFICKFFKTLFCSYKCFKELSYSWERLYNEILALQSQLNHNKVTRPLFKKTKIQHILNRASEIALTSSIQSEGYLLNLYDMFRKEALERGTIAILIYQDFVEIFRIAAIRVEPLVGEYIKSVIHDV